MPARNANEWLDSLGAMAAELEAGMQALAANRLPAFEESVSRQQCICRELAAAAPKVRTEEDIELGARIRSAAAAVKTLNARYAALLRHSGRSVKMFSTLYGGFAGHVPQDRTAAMPSRQTWSCEG